MKTQKQGIIFCKKCGAKVFNGVENCTECEQEVKMKKALEKNTMPTIKKIIKYLNNYDEDKPCAFALWLDSDVKTFALSNNVKLSEEQITIILNNIHEKFDAKMGRIQSHIELAFETEIVLDLKTEGNYSKERKKGDKVDIALELICQYGGIDGAHHKDWVIDQVARILAGDNYKQMVADACNGGDGPETYTWNCGIAP